jgi:hypothetical protein
MGVVRVARTLLSAKSSHLLIAFAALAVTLPIPGILVSLETA